MTKNKKIFIRRLFAHLEGIVVSPTLLMLNKRGIISKLKNNKSINIESLTLDKNTMPGYLHVALTTLSSLGITKKIIHKDNTCYSITDMGEDFIGLINNYSIYGEISQDLCNVITNDIKYEDVISYTAVLNKQLDIHESNFIQLVNSKDSIKNRIAYHVEGAILAPLFIYTKHYGLNKDVNSTINRVLNYDRLNNEDLYEYLLSRSKSYGVTASYQPIFSNLDDIIFKGKNINSKRDKNNNEKHVNRRLNVWGSGGAHKTYFTKIDEIIIEIFNQEIDRQPKGIADMGCGDGMLLKHLYELIKKETVRGQHIREYPLILIGADLNQQAINESKKTLIDAGIDCSFLIADISNPNQYKDDLKLKFNINIKDMLHVRSFLDHNRIYQEYQLLSKLPNIASTGAYSSKGRVIDSDSVLNNLIHHFSQWKKYVDKHGLLLLELHGLNTNMARQKAMDTPTIAYEATHGYSDQYIIEYDCFLECAKSAGLRSIEKYSNELPSKEITTISINLFK